MRSRLHPEPQRITALDILGGAESRLRYLDGGCRGEDSEPLRGQRLAEWKAGSTSGPHQNPPCWLPDLGLPASTALRNKRLVAGQQHPVAVRTA